MIAPIIAAAAQAQLVSSILPEHVDPRFVMAITAWITGFLCILNIVLALFFRNKQRKEVFTYYTASIIELAICVFALLFALGVITQSQIPLHLPSHLPVNRAEIGAALALGLGLFPAAYWHRINLSELPERIAEDAKVHKNHTDNVYVRKNTPGEWMN